MSYFLCALEIPCHLSDTLRRKSMRNYLLVPVLALSFVMFPAFSFSVQAQSHSVLSLDDCIRMGLEGNLMLQMQRLQLASASADVQIASV
jgi:hypothetical protein